MLIQQQSSKNHNLRVEDILGVFYKKVLNEDVDRVVTTSGAQGRGGAAAKVHKPQAQEIAKFRETE